MDEREENTAVHEIKKKEGRDEKRIQELHKGKRKESRRKRKKKEKGIQTFKGGKEIRK